jgi:hypothetical protein
VWRHPSLANSCRTRDGASESRQLHEVRPRTAKPDFFVGERPYNGMSRPSRRTRASMSTPQERHALTNHLLFRINSRRARRLWIRRSVVRTHPTVPFLVCKLPPYTSRGRNRAMRRHFARQRRVAPPTEQALEAALCPPVAIPKSETSTKGETEGASSCTTSVVRRTSPKMPGWARPLDRSKRSRAGHPASSLDYCDGIFCKSF